MKHRLFCLFGTLLTLFSCNSQKTQSRKLQQLLQQENRVIIDVRTKAEYAEGHLEGSLNIPLDQLQEALPTLRGRQQTPLIVVCRSGGRSTQAKLLLEQAGFTNVHNGGGWHALQQLITTETP